MIKILIPQIKGRQKSKVRGFWYSQDTKRTYYDYLTKVSGQVKELEFYKVKYNQESIFYTDTKTKQGYIYYNPNKIEVLKNRSIIKLNWLKRHFLRGLIKSALKLYGGVTIYLKKHSYILEVYHNKEV
jgi:hypothetical protein